MAPRRRPTESERVDALQNPAAIDARELPIERKKDAEAAAQEQAEAAVAEANAMLVVATAFSKMPTMERRENLFHAMNHLILAERFVPGILETFVRGAERE